jgi:hypothetical protein
VVHLNSSTKIRPVWFLLSLLAVTLVPASFGRVAANKATFEDTTGENPGGIDITSVLVSNNDEGLITVRINTPSRATFTEDMRARVWFDSDSNRETGLTETDFAGSDYFILWDREGTRLFRCSGSSCRNDAPQRTLSSSYRQGATFTISAFELGDTNRFKFTVYAAAGIRYDPATRRYDFAKATVDYAPAQDQSWSFTVKRGPSRLLVKGFSTAPAQPQAGKSLSVRVGVARADTGDLLSSGRVTCVARIRAKPLKPRSRGFLGRRATCVFAIPASAKGRTLRGSITIAFAGKRITKAFFRRIG